MASDDFVGRYKLYKKGTRSIVYWLTQTAGQLVDLKDIIHSLVSAASGDKHTKQSTKGGTQELEIRPAELVKLAEVISKSKPAVDIPEGITLIIKDVIAGRKECGSWYAAQTFEKSSSMNKENESHRFFVLVLERVYSILCAARTQSAGPHIDVKPDTRSTESSTLEGLFHRLQLEEPSDQALGDDHGHAPRPNGATGYAKTKFNIAQQEQDLAFETWCLLQDMQDIREFVEDSWAEYKRGEISFMVAGSVTAVAISLLRRADTEFGKADRRSTEWLEIMNYLGLRYHHADGVVRLYPRQDHHSDTDRLPAPNLNIAKLLCPIAFLCLQAYKDKTSILLGCLESYQEGTYDPKMLTGQKHTKLLHIFEMCLRRLSVSTVQFSVRKVRPPIFDDFVDGLTAVPETGKIPMWIVSACQIYLDLFDAMPNIPGQGCPHLQELFLAIQRADSDFRAYFEGLHPSLRDVEPHVKSLKNLSNWTKRTLSISCFPPSYDLTSPLEGLGDKQSRLPSDLAGLVPSYAGAYLLQLGTDFYYAGIELAAHDRIVLSMAHLYRAFRAQGLLAEDWKDMEFIIGLFGKSSSLVPSISEPFDLEKANRHYMMAIGYSPKLFAADASSKQPSAQPKLERCPRQITVSSPLLQALLECPRHKPERDGTPAHSLMDAAISGLVKSTGMRKGQKDHTLNASFTPMQLLAEFKETLIRDEPVLKFDYVKFTLQCVTLAECLNRKVNNLSVTPLQGEEQADVAVSVGALLSTPVPMYIKRDIARLLQSHIDAGGASFVEECKSQSSCRVSTTSTGNYSDEYKVYKKARQESLAAMKKALGAEEISHCRSGYALATYDAQFRPGQRGPAALSKRKIADVKECFEALHQLLMYEVQAHSAGMITESALRKEFKHQTGLRLVKLRGEGAIEETDVPDDTSALTWAVHLAQDYELSEATKEMISRLDDQNLLEKTQLWRADATILLSDIDARSLAILVSGVKNGPMQVRPVEGEAAQKGEAATRD